MRGIGSLANAIWREYDRALDDLFDDLVRVLEDFGHDESEWVSIVADELPGDIADAFEEWMA
ncbi:hypothetical protein SEA_BANTAM_120 [Gordonia phage Bantam]|uniref:Uncharacterized protein n=1 Tax=Gordonia phage Bantam TaxID=1887641 RepID=A0A1B3AYH8_9CAUD|nr:hypothetical protein BIZ77_gp059 [Gordonia phage Bantam]AOE43809.1 hypothetical protein SEA_BANTAM_120 [Gordonia phage Bantam]